MIPAAAHFVDLLSRLYNDHAYKMTDCCFYETENCSIHAALEAHTPFLSSYLPEPTQIPCAAGYLSSATAALYRECYPPERPALEG
jgi:hypothetical protein